MLISNFDTWSSLPCCTVEVNLWIFSSLYSFLVAFALRVLRIPFVHKTRASQSFSIHHYRHECDGTHHAQNSSRPCPQRRRFWICIFVNKSIRLFDRLSATIRDFDSVLEVPVFVEDAPVWLPLVVVCVELMFPRFIECLKPGEVRELLAWFQVA